MSEGQDVPAAGVITFDIPGHGTVHKEWHGSWPPPEHIAVSRVHPHGREPAIAVLDAIAWVTDQGIMPHAQTVWIYDQVSVSAELAPEHPNWAPPDSTTPLLPAAVYRRRDNGLKLIPGGNTHGSRPAQPRRPEQPEGQPAADPGGVDRQEPR